MIKTNMLPSLLQLADPADQRRTRQRRFSCARFISVSCRSLMIAAVLLLFPWKALAAAPTLSGVEVTDITPGSFIVTGTASEPSTAALSLFQYDCVTAMTYTALVSEGSDTTGAFRLGASGLLKNRRYCWRITVTSKSTSESIQYPDQPVSVKTAKTVTRLTTTGATTVPFANDLLKAPPAYQMNAEATSEGILEVMYLLDQPGMGPLSLVYSTDDSKNYFNLNNLFDVATAGSLNLTGGERVKISERHGMSECVIDRYRRVPADSESTKAADFTASPNPLDTDFNSTVNILDVLRAAKAMNTAQGDTCFNNELDMNTDGAVDMSDLNAVIGGFDAKP